MAFDYKKEYKEFYMPKNKPSIVEIPKMNYVAVRGKGNPNEENSEYKDSIGLLYAIAFTIKMSYKGTHKIDGYFEYVVPPLEGFWWQDENKLGIDYKNKDKFNFISVIRLPDFVSKEDFNWAIEEATRKKKQDFSKVEFLTYDEGICVQCMHIGSYDDEPATINLMHKFVQENGYKLDITDTRLHHEIYLSDPRKCSESRLKTVIRHPIKKIEKYEVNMAELTDKKHKALFSPLDNDSILYLSFSARNDGNSSDIAQYLIRENDKLVLFKDIFYTPCSKCNYECFSSICKYRYDDIYDLLNKANSYKKIVFIVPMYCGNPSSLYFIISERMQDYFSHNENKWDIFINKLHFICIYGSDEETPYFIEIFKNILKDENKILKIERHKYNLKMNDRVIDNKEIIKLLDDYKIRLL